MIRVCWYNLPLNRDERRLIYAKLDGMDWTVSRLAHNETRVPTLYDLDKWAAHGNLNLLIWAKSKLSKSQWNGHRQMICFHASDNGHLEILQWFKTNDKILRNDTRICDVAACRGNLEMLKWARSQNPPLAWDGWVRYWAERKGHVDLLQWAIDHGAPKITKRIKLL